MNIKSEDQAWAIVRQYLKGETIERPVFEGWPTMNIEIRGSAFVSSLSAAQMDAYLEFQAVISRSFAALSKGHFDARYLTKDEEAELTIRTAVSKGSSILKTDLSPLVHAVATVVKNASPTELIVGAILICLTLSSPVIVKNVIDGRIKELELKNSAAMIKAISDQLKSQEKLADLYAKAMKKLEKRFPAIIGLQPQIKRSQIRLIKSIDDADEAIINGIKVDQEQIRSLNNRKPSEKKIPQILKARLIIGSMEKRQDSYLLRLKSQKHAVQATLDIATFADQKIDILIVAFRQSIGVNFEINISNANQPTLSGEIVDFTVPNVIY